VRRADAPERAVRRERLLREHVEARAGETAVEVERRQNRAMNLV
jgi:hypothetical protein